LKIQKKRKSFVLVISDRGRRKADISRNYGQIAQSLVSDSNQISIWLGSHHRGLSAPVALPLAVSEPPDLGSASWAAGKEIADTEPDQ
jgi:hypothetical protein